ncbi:hypothetical protein [Gloeothece verrucosa]|uniref:Uncharacterized protein n=1 Tax=Gloeothece verrucosa (strain PCC 7822) TaxID=497965 RepID=E0UBL0_GLOV7|nr:hypothetical protein [Gloeothece verrucosa]ADN13954.1 hypothetical protein Cyan7822_1972 [Gloeothece verrucosa PCC 7822]
MKKLTSFLAVILSFVVCLGGVNPAFAQQLPEPASRGITTFYATPEQQAQGVKVYQDILKYDVAIPNTDLSQILPENQSDFPAAYRPILEEGRKKNGTNGSFTEGWFDFQAANAVTTGTNVLFTINAPLNGRIYSVVAGFPESQCPLNIQSTEIAFFDNVKDAELKAKELDGKGYLVYVSPVDDLTIKAFSQLFYDQDTGKKKTKSDCFLVSGATKNVKVDFSKIFYLLPPALQQPAIQAPFEYGPRIGNFIYLVNARLTLTIQGGNTILNRAYSDSQNNLYLVDTNNSINVDGEIRKWNVWAKNTLPVQLIIYRRNANSWSVIAKSDLKTPVVGANSFDLPSPISVKKGDFVGLYFPQKGSVAFSLDNGPWNLGNLSGKVLFVFPSPEATATAFSGSSNRTYSINVK